MTNEIILVDENDKAIGYGEKMQVHKEGKLHRCFSILIFNDKKEMLLQKRAEDKYHCGGLWTNACCSHPYKGEDIEKSALKRLNEEMGFTCDLKEIFSFTYKVEFDNGLTEHEFDHVFIGTYNSDPIINTEEVSEFKWINLDDLAMDIKNNHLKYSEWFKIMLDKLLLKINAHF